MLYHILGLEASIEIQAIDGLVKDLSSFKKVRGTLNLITNLSIMRLPDASQLGPLLHGSEAWTAMSGREIRNLQ